MIQKYNYTIMFKLFIDHRSDTPIYQQIVDQVAAHIQQGTLTSGDQLPTVRAVATELKINFNTVSRAYRILDEAGIICTQQGRGTYILELPANDLNASILSDKVDHEMHTFLTRMAQLGFTAHQATNLLITKTAYNNESEHP